MYQQLFSETMMTERLVDLTENLVRIVYFNFFQDFLIQSRFYVFFKTASKSHKKTFKL